MPWASSRRPHVQPEPVQTPAAEDRIGREGLRLGEQLAEPERCAQGSRERHHAGVVTKGRCASAASGGPSAVARNVVARSAAARRPGGARAGGRDPRRAAGAVPARPARSNGSACAQRGGRRCSCPPRPSWSPAPGSSATATRAARGSATSRSCRPSTWTPSPRFVRRGEVRAEELRRNLVVSGLNLAALKGRRVRVGERAVLEITGACHPVLAHGADPRARRLQRGARPRRRDRAGARRRHVAGRRRGHGARRRGRRPTRRCPSRRCPSRRCPPTARCPAER